MVGVQVLGMLLLMNLEFVRYLSFCVGTACAYAGIFTFIPSGYRIGELDGRIEGEGISAEREYYTVQPQFQPVPKRCFHVMI